MPNPDHDIEDDSPQTAGDDGSSGSESHRYDIPKRLVGRRLDQFLRQQHPRISRTILQRIIKEGSVTVNGKKTKASYEPAAGDVVEIKLPPPPPSRIVPEDIPLDIIYEDDWLIVINKHAGIVCHPARATQSGTVANAVAFHATTLSNTDDPFRPGIIHRLDKNTTGVMVMAKTDEAHWRVAQQFERRTIKKEYYAICEGVVRLDGDIINKPLAPHPVTTQRMVTPSATPPRQAMFKDSITEYRVDKRYEGYTTVKLFPKTGRTHQLRVHMSSIGHPLVGDKLYAGHLVSAADIARDDALDATPLLLFQALHARRIKLMHPIHETPLEIEAPLPATIVRIIELLEEHRRK